VAEDDLALGLERRESKVPTYSSFTDASNWVGGEELSGDMGPT
jgi:hypothetical protein